MLPHTWEQTWDLITLAIPNCPITDRKKVKIIITRDSINVSYTKEDGTYLTFGGDLLFPIYKEYTWYWTDDTLYIEMPKVDKHKWWTGIVSNVEEKMIPLTSRPTHEYPDYVQTMLHRDGKKMMAAQERPDLV
jgi:hypothetical protein